MTASTTAHRVPSTASLHRGTWAVVGWLPLDTREPRQRLGFGRGVARSKAANFGT